MPTTHPLGHVRLGAADILSADDIQAFRNLPFQIRSVEAGSYVSRQCAASDSFYALLSGFAYRGKILRNGSQQIVSIYLPGDFVDPSSLLTGVALANVQMLTSGKLASVSAAALKRLLDDRPRLQRALWHQTISEASISAEWLANLGRRDAQGRVAHLICEFAARLNAAGDDVDEISLPMTQAQIADATGLTPVHVNRVVQKLRREEVLRSNRRSLTVQDWKRLREIAEFDPLYLEGPRAEVRSLH
jgi:CRP-like cAMP-binding protein